VITNSVNDVQLKGRYLIVNTIHNNSFYIEELMYRWYRNQAEITFTQILSVSMEKVKKYNIKFPIMKIKRMKRKWGSCNPNNRTISLNLELIRAPSQCIEYVIMHELCHLKFAAHDKRYYDFLSMVLPDWKDRKYKLKEIHII